MAVIPAQRECDICKVRVQDARWSDEKLKWWGVTLELHIGEMSCGSGQKAKTGRMDVCPKTSCRFRAFIKLFRRCMRQLFDGTRWDGDRRPALPSTKGKFFKRVLAQLPPGPSEGP